MGTVPDVRKPARLLGSLLELVEDGVLIVGVRCDEREFGLDVTGAAELLDLVTDYRNEGEIGLRRWISYNLRREASL